MMRSLRAPAALRSRAARPLNVVESGRPLNTPGLAWPARRSDRETPPHHGPRSPPQRAQEAALRCFAGHVRNGAATRHPEYLACHLPHREAEVQAALLRLCLAGEGAGPRAAGRRIMGLRGRLTLAIRALNLPTRAHGRAFTKAADLRPAATLCPGGGDVKPARCLGGAVSVQNRLRLRIPVKCTEQGACVEAAGERAIPGECSAARTASRKPAGGPSRC
jgi:hypothetical protein